ncbi:hypothetical protein [Nonomuraea sp. KM90]|uniref:hypothetical protein n=1 Tax=Nonomuraea sp. KM90 TaxID=3457428 RepID=UPI003FCD9799
MSDISYKKLGAPFMTTVMLVHGAWHQPSSWARLEAELHALGYGTRTPGLPSAGEHPTAGMHESMYAIHGLADPEDTSGLFPLSDEPACLALRRSAR